MSSIKKEARDAPADLGLLRTERIFWPRMKTVLNWEDQETVERKEVQYILHYKSGKRESPARKLAKD